MYKKNQKQISNSDSVLSVKTGRTLITYDKEADAAYFSVRKGKVAKTIMLDKWLLADIDKNGGLLGVETLFVSLRAPKQSIVSSLKTNKLAHT
jgi:uncharacterized protein YuzE